MTYPLSRYPLIRSLKRYVCEISHRTADAHEHIALDVFGTQLASLLTGSMIVETIFSWPGFGYLLIMSVQRRDYAVVQFGVLITATIVIVANLLVDITYGLIDPRIRTEG